MKPKTQAIAVTSTTVAGAAGYGITIWQLGVIVLAVSGIALGAAFAIFLVSAFIYNAMYKPILKHYEEVEQWGGKEQYKKVKKIKNQFYRENLYYPSTYQIESRMKNEY